MVNENENKIVVPSGNDSFESFKDGASLAQNYLKKNMLYVINYSKKPKQTVKFGEWVEKNFVERDGGKKQNTQYTIEVINTVTGLPEEVTITSKVYLDIIKMHDEFAKIQKSNPRLTLFPYIKAVAVTA